MKLLIVLLLFLTACSGEDETRCIIRTEIGDIELGLYPEKAPTTVTNFLRYIDSSLYDSSSFFRVCTPANEEGREYPIEVIQGGWLDDRMEFEAIELENTDQSGISHKDGTISMARAEPNTATSSYFICINDQPELDHGGRRNPDGSGFAAFGRVLKGMDIVRQIQSQPDSAQMLLDPIVVYSIQRLPL